MTTNVFSKGDVLEIVATKFILPTVDVYLDISLIVDILATELEVKRQRQQMLLHQVAFIMIGFLVLSFLMMIPHYLRAEKSWNPWNQRLATILLLFLQIWPQYRAARLLWFAFVRVDIEKCLREKLVLERDISHVEPFIESVPQSHLSLIVVCIVKDNSGDKGFYPYKPRSLLSFISSVVSGTLGLSKVLLKGPVRLVPSNRGYLGGFVQLPFFLLYLSVFTCLVGKAAWLPSSMTEDGEIYVLLWFALMIAPQATMSFALLFYYCGRNKVWTIIARWPSFLLLPIFSIYSFAGVKIGRKWYLTVSSKWTWINLFICALGICGGIVFVYATKTCEDLVCRWYMAMMISGPLIFGTFICHSLLTLPKSCPCSCIQTPFIQKTVLDIDTLEVVNLEDLQTETDPDLELNLVSTTQS